MKKVKFLHCADIHLDAPFTSLGGGSGKASIRRQDLKDTFQKIINIAKEQKVDMLLISGDLYEHNYVRKSTINFINDLFKQAPEVRIFIVPGNHDPYIPNSFYKNFKWSENVHILTGETPYILLEDIGVCVYGVGFKNFYEEKALAYDIKPIGSNYINILLVHGTVDMNFKQNLYNPMDSDNLGQLNMDYIALGHFHNRIDDIGGYGIIYNPGSPEALGYDEEGEHGAFLGTISKSDNGERTLENEFIVLGKKYHNSLIADVSGCCTDEQIAASIEDSIRKAPHTAEGSQDLTKGLYLITLKGYIESGFKINISFIQDYFTDKVFFLRLKDETNADYNFEEIMGEGGLRGLFVRKIYELIDKADEDYEKRLLTKALYYGLEALETGKVEII